MKVSLRILLVEDEWLIAEDYADHLIKAGHEVVGPVPSVESALDRLTHDEIDLALLDVHLSGDTSYRLADLLRQKKIPFAFVTGYESGELPKRFARSHILQKPVAPSELVNAVTVFVAAQPDAR